MNLVDLSISLLNIDDKYIHSMIVCLNEYQLLLDEGVIGGEEDFTRDELRALRAKIHNYAYNVQPSNLKGLKKFKDVLSLNLYELETIISAAGIVISTQDKVKKEERLTPEEKKDAIETADKLANLYNELNLISEKYFKL